jgi:hypothetical protein
LRLWPDGTGEPVVSQVTFSAGSSYSNTVLLPLGSSGAVRMRAAAAHVSTVVSLVGYVAPAGAVAKGDLAGHQRTMLPTRITLAPLTVTSASTTIAGQAVAGIPIAGAQGLVLLVTVIDTTAPGALRLYANGTAEPTTPSLLVSPGTPVTTTVLVASGKGGLIQLKTDGPTVKCIVEVVGYTTAS